jgi:hypothetical protein
MTPLMFESEFQRVLMHHTVSYLDPDRLESYISFEPTEAQRQIQSDVWIAHVNVVPLNNALGIRLA